MKTISLILARGGSKGIPNKNIIDLNGFPLIYYAIKASKESPVDDTWISTDDLRIKEIALEYNCKVLDRPEELATDSSKSDESLMHFMDNVDFDILVFIQPTSPLLDSEDINNGLKLMQKYDSVFSAYKEHWLPRWDKNIVPVNWNINSRPMRQEIDYVYVENGAFYITSRTCLKESQLRYSGNIGIYEMPFDRSVQIDSYCDLELVRKIIY